MDKIAKVEICLENCEVYTLYPKDIDFLKLEQITKSLTVNGAQYTKGEVASYQRVGEVHMRIKPHCLHNSLYGEQEYSEVVKRLAGCPDITQIHISCLRGVHNWYYVAWPDDCAEVNPWQTGKEENGMLMIEIRKRE